MKKGIIFLLAASTLFGLGFVGQTQKVEAAETWNLVTNANELEVGKEIIIAAKDYDFAISTTQNKNNRGQASITKSEKTVSVGSGVQILTLKEGTKSGTFGLYTGSAGYLYAASSSSNYLKTETTLSSNSSWSFTITSDGTATVKANGNYTRNVLQYNKNSSLFSCYSSASQQAIVIYMLNDSSTGEDSGETSTNKLETPVLNIDPQTGIATWEAVENATTYTYTIGSNDSVTTNDLTAGRPLKDGESIKVFANGDNETYSDSDSVEATYDAPANIKVENLLNSYYFDGCYTRTTKINLNINDSDVLKEINNIFHAGSILLERTTHFNGDSLWMTNEETDEKGTYSYYGTKYDGDTPVGVTGGRVALNETTSNVVLSGEGKESMEKYYTTMDDIKANKAEWTKEGNVFTTEDDKVIKMFLDFTAPCFLNYTATNSNYFTLSKAQIEETSQGLELRLVTSGDEGKLTDSNGVLSTAIITKFNPSSNDVLTEDVEISFKDKNNRTFFSSSQQIWEQNGIVLTNNKENSTNDIADYSNPARFYKSSKVKIESTVGKFNQIVVNTDGKEYSSALVSSINSTYDNVATSNDSTTVTISFDESVSSIEFVLTGGQVRINTITLKNI